MASEGSREIEAAKQRLAAAKTQVSSASEMVESTRATVEAAKKNMEVAQSQLVNSRKEVERAEEFLKEAERRWEVVDLIAEGDDDNSRSGPRKKRKVVSPVEGANAAEGNGNNDVADTTARQNYRRGQRECLLAVECPQGHRMKAEALNCEGWCDSCSINGTSATCRMCNFDLCPTCQILPQAEINANMALRASQIKCPRGHFLKSDNVKNRPGMSCDSCSQSIIGSSATCIACDYDLCPHCWSAKAR